MVKKISLVSLVLLIVAAIDSIRNLPATALFGSALVFFFLFVACVFLFPVSLVAAEFASRYPEEGGIFPWIGHAFGKRWAFLAVWLQWINTVVWYPTILSFIAGTAAYLVDPHLADNKVYLVLVILCTFWLVTLVNLFGLKTSARFASICTVIGLIIPVTLIIGLAVIWLILGKPIQLQFTTATMLPSLTQSENWISLTAIITSFLGIELASVHVKQINNSQRLFPKALFYSTLLILFTMISGSLAIALILPQNQINLVAGIMEAFTKFLQAYHLQKAIPLLTLLILVGSFGQIINWIISPAKGLQQAAAAGFLPRLFAHQNKQGVADVILISQAVLVSFICIAFLLMPSINGSYWFLTDLSTEIYVMMYVLMFIAALALHYKSADMPKAFKVPGGSWGFWLV